MSSSCYDLDFSDDYVFQFGMWIGNEATVSVYLLFGMTLSIHFFLHAGFSALHWAVDGGHVDVVQYVLGEGVPVSQWETCIASHWGSSLVGVVWVWSRCDLVCSTSTGG